MKITREQKEIDKIHSHRNKLLTKYYDGDTINVNISKEVDKLRDDITLKISEYFDNLPIDYIIESFTHVGDAPCLIYDDNGRFAVGGTNYQPVAIKSLYPDQPLTIHVEYKACWKKTIREAVRYYVKRRLSYIKK